MTHKTHVSSLNLGRTSKPIDITMQWEEDWLSASVIIITIMNDDDINNNDENNTP